MAGSVSEVFTYDPLDATTQEIRLVRILPKSSSGWPTLIDFELFHAKQSDDIRYEALSYVWGSQNKPYKIRVNGKGLFVTQNLFAALLHLRSDTARTFWIDAVCINQNSTTERNHQVSIMRSIFSKADRTIVWLGDIGFTPIMEHPDLFSYISSGLGSPFVSPYTTIWSAQALLLERNIKTLLSCAWFKRIWVVQELACSETVVVQIADKQISWDHLVTFADQYLKAVKLDRGESMGDIGQRWRGGHDLSNIQILHETRRIYRSGDYSELLYLIFHLSQFEASDSLDRIYAIAGLAAHQDLTYASVPIDYGLSLKQIAANVARHHLTVRRVTATSEDFAMLAFRTHINSVLGGETSPSESLWEPYQREWRIYDPDVKYPVAGSNPSYILRGILVGDCLTAIGWVKLVFIPEAPVSIVLLSCGTEARLSEGPIDENSKLSYLIIDVIGTSDHFESSKPWLRGVLASTDNADACIRESWCYDLFEYYLTAWARPVGSQKVFWESMMASPWSITSPNGEEIITRSVRSLATEWHGHSKGRQYRPKGYQDQLLLLERQNILRAKMSRQESEREVVSLGDVTSFELAVRAKEG